MPDYAISLNIDAPAKIAVSGAMPGAKAIVPDPARVMVLAAERGAPGEAGPAGPPGPPGPGVAKLGQLQDVVLIDLAQNDLLEYDSTLQIWTNRRQSTVTDGGNF